MKPTYPYTVKGGDWLAKIAEEHGTTVSEIWNHPDNAELRAKRGSPDVLYPGDIVHIPHDPPATNVPKSVPPPPVDRTTPVPPPPIDRNIPHSGQFTLFIEGEPVQTADVVRFRGRERLSRGFRLEITALLNPCDYDDVRQLVVGRRAAFVIAGLVPRIFRGVVCRARVLDGAIHQGLQPVAVTLVPHLALLRHRRRSRVFQNLKVEQIVGQVLGEAGIAVRASLHEPRGPRVYCTQYEETDLQFVRRILAEAGIYHVLDDPPAGATLDALVSAITGSAAAGVRLFETWLLSDSALGYPGLADTSSSVVPGAVARVPFLESDLAAEHACVTELRRAASVGATSAAYADRDPAKPNVRLYAAKNLAPPDGGVRRPASPHGGGLDLEYYEHHAPYLFPDWKEGLLEPQRILEQRRRHVDAATGAANVAGFAAGRRFVLEGHPADGLNGEYVLTSVRHEGDVTSTTGEGRYTNRFECVPARVAYRPKRPRRRNVMAALTATVVGPPGEEIHVDAMGQIKVQFHWDREGAADDRASCWVRTMQPLTGAGWGTQFIPRVGSEVVVTFEGGDLDKPIVIGCVYDGTHPPPFALPADASKTGMRTRSTPGGGNFSELSFDDRSGAELVYLRAARDLRTEVEQDHDVSIGQHLRVQVTGAKHERIATSAHTEVGGDHNLAVTGDSVRDIQGSETHTVNHALHQRVSGTLTQRFEGPSFVDCDQEATHVYHATFIQKTHGHDIRVVGEHTAPASSFTHVEGRSTLFASQRIELTSATEVVIQCGQSAIRIGPQQIDIMAPNVNVGDTDSQLNTSPAGLTAKSNAARLVLSAAGLVARTKDGASMAMAREVKVDAAQILLNSPAEAEDAPPPDPIKPTTIVVTDQHGAPVPHQRLLIRLGDGTEIPAVLDGDGRCIVEIPEQHDPTVSFRDLHGVGPN